MEERGRVRVLEKRILRWNTDETSWSRRMGRFTRPVGQGDRPVDLCKFDVKFCPAAHAGFSFFVFSSCLPTRGRRP